MRGERKPPTGGVGGEHERGNSPPLVRGGGGLGPPPRKFLSASMCVFNVFFMRLGPHFIRFGHKDISCRVRNRLFTDSHMFFLTFFLQHV